MAARIIVRKNTWLSGFEKPNISTDVILKLSAKFHMPIKAFFTTEPVNDTVQSSSEAHLLLAQLQAELEFYSCNWIFPLMGRYGPCLRLPAQHPSSEDLVLWIEDNEITW